MLTSAPAQALSTQHWLFAYGGALLSMLALDALWIGLYMAPAYKSALGDLMLEQPRIGSAAAFYLLYAAGAVFLAVAPGLRAVSWQTAMLNGVVLGLIAYGTYDLTNYSILKAWPLGLALVDIAWGVLLTALASAAGWYVANRWG
ncbi:DUF2177 family protein [Pseudoduganella sp. FT25W]|uniref:DUF2177 family protein n=1 Tax=Duganella alba TaxID=2666081 RepID=A0A6L5QAQ3_9BURK|nr:DUF2177 family protein [Duganella alba]MRX06598.1 DUF2177 family protein [Duganella alba]MRX18052.1 DUF2177 family protein [Duganella alba]